MVIEKGIEAIQLANGYASADVKVKTDNGVVGMRVSFELRKNPDLAAAAEVVASAFEDALEDSLGLKDAANADLGEPVPEPVGDPVH